MLAGLKAFGAGRLAALAGIGAATLGLLLFVALRMTGDAPMAPLYSDLDLHDAGQMVDLLDKAHIPHQSGLDGTSLLVPADQVAQARMALARSGLPSGGSIGNEIFDRGDGLTASQFQQTVNQTRALEGELSRSIREIRGVRGVRVHLVLAKREPFAQEQQEAQASVLLTMAGATRMDRESIGAILNLVSAAVPGLKPQNIAMIDNRGQLLARAGQPADGAEGASSRDELKRATEARLSHAVEDMLERSLGAGHVRAEAAVDMDFDQTRETSERFDPDAQVARSTQNVTSSSKSTEKDASVSVANNLPNPDPGSSATGNTEQRQEETTNYEIGKSTRTTVHDQPQIRRITLAVMVDDTQSKDAGGKMVAHERTPEELARIGALARSVIGFDEKRGDKIDVVSMRFTADADVSLPAPSGLLGITFDRSDVMRIVQLLLFAVIALVALLKVLRPAALRLSAAPAGALPNGAEGQGAAGALAGANGNAGLLTDESMMSLQAVEGQLKASSLRKVADLVEKHPAESLAIMRGWMAGEAS